MILVDAILTIAMIIFLYFLVVYVAECISQNSNNEFAQQNYYLTIFFFFFVCWILASFIFTPTSRIANKNISACMYMASVIFLVNSLVCGWSSIDRKIKLILIVMVFLILCYYSYERMSLPPTDEDDE